MFRYAPPRAYTVCTGAPVIFESPATSAGTSGLYQSDSPR